MEALRKQIDELKVENTRLNGLVSEKELTELRTFINNSDSYVIEIQGYKDRLESSKNREDSLRRTIEDLKSTVEQLKG
jgi:archaellum component FlaC